MTGMHYHNGMEPRIDPDTERAVRIFLDRLPGNYVVARAILFGSRARHDFRPDSDADLAILLRGAPGKFIDAKLDMAGLAFDVLLDTGVLVQALPIWQEEWDHKSAYSNPRLLENIEREGIPV